MLLHECSPEVSARGILEFSIPGFGYSTGRLEPWGEGFDGSLVNARETVASSHFTLKFFAAHAARELPADVLGFIDEIPEDSARYVTRFEVGQCPLLQLLARHPEASDLSRSNPLLLWLLTTSVFDLIIDADEIPALLCKKQIEILRRLVKSASKASLKLLHKAELQQGTLTESRTLIQTLGNRHILKITAHLSTVPVALLRALARFPNLANPATTRILASCLPDDYHGCLVVTNDLADSLRDIYRMSDALGIDSPDRSLARCHTIEDLEQLHDRWVDRVNRRGELWIEPARRGVQAGELDLPDAAGEADAERERIDPEKLEFPDPPLPDSKTIRAIRNMRELIYEGKLQRNCVASYAPSIANNDIAIYKVLRPHRATLELRRGAGGWHLGQLKLSGNRPPGQALIRAVEDWYVARNGLEADEQDTDVALRHETM